MYYKITSENKIIDVSSGLSFVRFQEKNQMFLACDDESKADGILSSDGNSIYLLEGKQQRGEYPFVEYTEITEEKYEELHTRLVENGMIQNTEESNTEESAENDEVEKSKTLKLLEQMQTQMDMLTECILEISEALYA